MASAPPHVSNASLLTKQKLLQSIQVKEQQRLLEQHLGTTTNAAQEILAQALKNAMAVSGALFVNGGKRGSVCATCLSAFCFGYKLAVIVSFLL